MLLGCAEEKADPYGLFWNRFQDTLTGKQAETDVCSAWIFFSRRKQGSRVKGYLAFQAFQPLVVFEFLLLCMCHLKTKERAHCSHSLKTSNAVLIHLFAAIVLWALRPQTSLTTSSFLPNPQTVPSRSHHMERGGTRTLSSHPEWQELCLGKGLHSVQQSGHMECKLKCFKNSAFVSVSVKECEYRKRKTVMRNNLETV